MHAADERARQRVAALQDARARLRRLGAEASASSSEDARRSAWYAAAWEHGIAQMQQKHEEDCAAREWAKSRQFMREAERSIGKVSMAQYEM